MLKKAVVSLLVFLLVCPGLVFLQPTRAQTQPTLADTINQVTGEISNYQDGLETLAVGLQFGQVSMAQVNAYVNNVTDPLQYLDAVCELSKLNGFVVDQAKMEWALDGIPMMANGIPQTVTLTGTYSSISAFFLYDRFVLVGYQYALKYNYDLSKWNITQAYTSFHYTMVTNGVGLYISNTESVSSTGNTRYYDELSETLQIFLFFYEMGIPQAMIDANTLWQWANQSLWNNGHYDYNNYNTGFECEAGSFYEIALLYHYFNPLANITNVIVDANNRFLSNLWNSPQWENASYVTVHEYQENTQLRLENTLTAWDSLNGLYPSLNNTES